MTTRMRRSAYLLRPALAVAGVALLLGLAVAPAQAEDDAADPAVTTTTAPPTAGAETPTTVPADDSPTTTAPPADPPAPTPAVGGPEAAPANDDFASAEVLAGASGSTSGTNVDATLEAGEPDHGASGGDASVWFTWTAPADGVLTLDTCTGTDFDTVLAVYTGATLGSLNLEAESDDYCGLASGVPLDVTSGTTYQIAIDGYKDLDDITATGSYTLTWALGATLPSPANDDFADAELLSGASGSVSGSTQWATAEPGEPDHAGYPAQSSVWYRWTAPADGEVTFDTCASDFDTVLAAYLGDELDFLFPTAGNDDSCGVESQVTFFAAAGSIYSIAVDGFAGTVGNVTLAWSLQVSPPPPNDNFADAQALSGPTGSVDGTTAGATREAGEPTHAGVGAGRSVWYRWSAEAAGQLSLDTCGSDNDTVLALYTGPSVDDLEFVAGNDDSCELQSRVDAPVDQATTYWIAVDTYGSNGLFTTGPGPFTLAWSFTATPPPPPPPPPPGPVPPELARTGVDTGPLVLDALALVAVGALALVGARRLRSARTTTTTTT